MKKIVKLIGIIGMMGVMGISRGGAEGVNAQEMSSQNFRLQGGNFNMTSGNKASQNFKLSDVVGQTAAGLFASKGYLIQAGFLYGAGGAPFVFTVSPPLVDFGSLTPNNPIEKNVTITIANGNANGYTVNVSQNQSLSTTVGAEIPDTACDASIEYCTQKQAAKWTQSTAYGFGYRVSGKTTPADFKEGFFRPFPATKRGEQPILIMQSKAKKVTDTAQMTLRLNVGPNQPVGLYKNVLIFTAVAGI